MEDHLKKFVLSFLLKRIRARMRFSPRSLPLRGNEKGEEDEETTKSWFFLGMDMAESGLKMKMLPSHYLRK